MSYLLDTCVISELTKNSPSTQVTGWLAGQVESSLYISQVTLAELAKGVVKLQAKDPVRAGKLGKWLARVRQRFEGRTLPTDEAVWRVWADITGLADVAGRSVPPVDALLMATAQCHGLTVVTRNVGDFARYPKVFSPWVDLPD